MNSRTAIIVGLCAFVATSFGESQDERPTGPAPITDLKTQLIGTSWRAEPNQPLRGGLAPILTFTEHTVAPAGYHYEVNADDKLTVTFSHGDTQLMELAPDGKHLQFTFNHHEYAYQNAEMPEGLNLGSSSITDLETQLSGTRWKAVPSKPLRGGLAAQLTFREGAVAPAGYHYDVNAHNSLTIHFNRGGTQLMLLTPDGKHLKFIFGQRDYAYVLVSR